MVFWIALLGILVVLIWIPFRIAAVYTIQNTKDQLNVTIFLFRKIRIFRFQRGFFEDIPKKLQRWQKKKEKRKEKKKQKKRRFGIQNIMDTIHALLSRANLEKLSIRMKIGMFEDAYFTALVCGGIQAVVLPILLNLLPEKNHPMLQEIKIHPEFQRECLEVRIECILTLRLAHIIRVAFKTQK